MNDTADHVTAISGLPVSYRSHRLRPNGAECDVTDIRMYGIFPVYGWRVFPFRWAHTPYVVP